MSNGQDQGERCRQIEEHLAELLEGTAPEWVLEHVAECDRCRDLRYEAERLCAELSDAGADFVLPADFEAKLRAALVTAEVSGEVTVEPLAVEAAGATVAAEPAAPEAASATVAAEPAKAEEPKAEEPKAEEPKAEEPKAAPATAEPVAPEAAGATEIAEPAKADGGWAEVQRLEEERRKKESESSGAGPVADATAADDRGGASEASARGADERSAKKATGGGDGQGAKVVSLVDRLRRPRNAVMLALGCAAAAAAIVAIAVHKPGTDPGALASAEGWQGKVVRVSRAAGGSGGLELCDRSGQSCRPAEPNARIEMGAVLRTDERTRAYVELDDGTRLALDRSTRFAMLETDERAAKLDTGAIVIDVAKIEGAGAHIELPSGRLDVLGTKFALRALGESVAVDVSRGVVKLTDREGRNVTVRAGEEGRMYPGMAPYASGAPALGEAMSWSDPTEADRAGSDSAVRGLGELRAKKPGETDERKGAVSLTSHQVKTRIVDGFARTEIEEVFTNTTDEVLEGIYRFPMPPDAQIERLALEVDGHYEEGAFVDRDRAAAIWRGAIVHAGAKKPIQEEIIWVPGPWKDPALLEWQRGGRFELRIYPIPRKGSRKVVLAYTQVVAPVGKVMRYVYPLGHDPSGHLKVSDFGVDVQLRGHDKSFGVSTQGYALGSGEPAASVDAERLTMKASEFVPNGDLVVEYALPPSESELTAWAYQWTGPAAGAGTSTASPASSAGGTTSPSASPPSSEPASVAGVDLGGSPYVVMALRPKLPRASEQLERAFVLVVDASRSMVGERYRRASELAVRLVEELDRLDRFTVLACDTSCKQLPGGLRYPGHEIAKEVESFLAGVTPEGGSDLGVQLREARAAASSAEGRAVRVVYLGDGTPTVGPIRPRYLERAVSEGLPGDKASLTAVAIGTDADLDALGAMARAGGGVVLPYVPGQRLGEAAYAILGASYGMGLREARLEMPTGLVEVAPTRLDTIPSGGQALVVARMTSPEVEGTVVLRGKVGEEAFEQRYPLSVKASTAAGNAFVPRLYAALRIADLERQGDSAARSNAIALSQRFNVASRYTSLLVLESAAMFKAFGLDNTRYAPSWTGEEATDSTGAKGELDVAGADDELDAAYASGVGQGFGSGAGSRGGPADRKASKPKAESSWEAAGEPAAPAATATSPWAQPPAAASPAPAPAKRAVDAADEMERPARSRPPRPRGNMIPMRKIWERLGSVSTAQLVPAKASAAKLGEAEQAVRADENRREAVKELYVLRMLAGQLDGAREVAERWSSRDALDPDALVARADVAASSGNRDEAIRILGSVVDVRPGDVPSQERLARLHRWAGRAALGCRHSLALAQLREKDGKLLADAVWCARQTGEGAWAEQILAAADADTRRVADRELGKKQNDKNELRGELRLEANWQGGADVDLALLHPEGHRVSWLGAPTKGLISAVDVTSTAHEGLALLGSDAGDYVIEVSRASGDAPVSGTVSVHVPGMGRRDIPFSLAAGEQRKALGIVNVRWQSRLVPL